METTFRIRIQGRVQGVGFRPFVYREAITLGLVGRVSNNEAGVEVVVSGDRKKLETFYRRITLHAPPISRVVNCSFDEIPFEAAADFSIDASSKNRQLNLQLTPDFALCPDCFQDLINPENRRFGYPFISCTNCGPRWALTRTFPFEREHTSMQFFPMCTQCTEEYSNPTDRRFHSQTNSCHTCGISYWIADAQGLEIPLTDESVFQQLARLLSVGKIIALKNTSGYLLCCDATSAGSIKALRAKKQRPKKPFAVLYPSLEHLEDALPIGDAERQALQSPERPIVLLPTTHYHGNARLSEIAPGLNQLGVMLPYTGILSLLSRAFRKPLIATSGNIHGAPICFTESDARKKLAGTADYFFEHNLEIIHPQDDSVMRFASGGTIPILLRRARGLAPNFSKPVQSDRATGLMALGAQLKSSIGFIPNDFIYISEYLGNLENYDVYERFTKMVSGFISLFDKQPTALLTDSHPDYLSTQYGKDLSAELGIPCHQIQHHKAHFSAVLGENDLFSSPEPILGVVWDGTGYGEDGQIWGGEFFRYAKGSISRVGQLEYFDWLAGDAMSRNPQLSLFSLLDGDEGSIKDRFSPQAWKLYTQIKPANTLKTSSMGRLFDGVSALLGICDLNTFEGEAAMLLEAASSGYDMERANSLVSLDAQGNIPVRKLIREIKSQLEISGDTCQVAGDFIFTLAKLILEKAELESVAKIAFSGGVFQNALLVHLIRHLNPGTFELYFHRELSPNDENIPFGQLMYHLHCHS
ncbi:carbamoyltransferase HypF [Robiginitalea aurantiaca]|uniref:Carbamoyltransferase n=1 Tax=Robiginitalea aurantiaca TaxID=3056915 RepID=A0ABT7WB53_9FLAO|nr:carbamoyltransferase HypF [Robiginitalea aurantiaca]MDM9630150.1 carbamoyltransferase HypF [Robiginitalea aurantiaca]